jgi:hypothetical protein
MLPKYLGCVGLYVGDFVGIERKRFHAAHQETDWLGAMTWNPTELGNRNTQVISTAFQFGFATNIGIGKAQAGYFPIFPRFENRPMTI